MHHNLITKENRSSTRPSSPSSDTACDSGQFGWSEIAGISVPYLINKNNKWVSKRMAETKLLEGINMIFTTELLLCIKVKIIHATQSQARLLNEINNIHSDNMYGTQPFMVNDPLFSLYDAEECAKFMEYFINVFSKKKLPTNGCCGFIKIAKQQCVPFVRVDKKQYVPLFYFDGETDYLNKMTIDLSGWHATYLRVACRVQDINKKYFDTSTIRCVDLDMIKKFFYPNTSFENVWPEEYTLDALFRLSAVPFHSRIYEKTKSKDTQNIDTNLSQIMPTNENENMIQTSYVINTNNITTAPSSTNTTTTTATKNLINSLTGPPVYRQENVYHNKITLSNSERYKRSMPYLYPSSTNTTIKSAPLQSVPSYVVSEPRVVVDLNQNYPNKKVANIGNTDGDCKFSKGAVVPTDNDETILMKCKVIDKTTKSNISDDNDGNNNSDMLWLERVATLYFKKSPTVFRNALQHLGVTILHPPVQTYPTFPRQFGIYAAFGAIRLADLKEHCTQLKLMMS